VRGGASRRDARNTYLVAECGDFLFAFDSLRVRRAFLNDGIQVTKSAFDNSRPGERARCPPIASFAGETWVAWDLGLIVKRDSGRRSWLLFDLPYRGSTIGFGLRVGACVAVANLEDLAALPSGMFERRNDACRAVFVVDEKTRIGSAYAGRVGIVIDERRLLTPAELQASAAALGIEPVGDGAWL
jgi:hypothetical protein